jgi:bla regulator protein BlaR1
VFFWFNPFLPFYKKAIQLNHEFLADEAVTNECHNVAAYQHLLINKANKQPISSLTSPLNYLITKKRLIMMTKTRSFMRSVCMQLAVIPLLTVSVFVFSEKAIAQQSMSSQQVKQQGGNSLDTSVKRMLERYMGAHKSVGKGENGMALVFI